MSPGRYVIGPITWYSFLILCGMILAILLAGREARRKGLPEDTIVDLALLVIPAGIIGARLYYVLFSLDQYRANPISALYIWEGGLAIYGGLIFGAAAVWLYTRRKRLSLWKVLDALAPGVVLAQGIGRWGNFFNSEAYGLPITDPAWQFFPAGVLIDEGGTLVWHMAAFFYESLWNVMVFAALWLSRKRMRRDGDTFLWYALLYAAGRQLIEGLRMDSLYAPGGGIRVSQALAVAVMAAVLVIFTVRAGKERIWLAFAVAVGASLGAALLEIRQSWPAPGLRSPVILVAGISCALLAYRCNPVRLEADHADRNP